MSSSQQPDTASAPGPSTSSGRAPKGKACLSCRRRKMRCDCTRPVCGQCVRFNRERDCEYTDGDQRSRTEILEEKIATLQARIRTLEGSMSSSSSLPLTSFPHSSASYSRGSPLPLSAHDTGSGNSSPNSHMSQHTESSPAFSDLLVETFLAYADDLGFFLDVTRFLNHVSFLYSTPGGSSQDPLLATVHLWGAVLQSNEQLCAHEAGFLSNAVGQLSNIWSSQTYCPIRIIQAEILLANYYFYSGRLVEGRAHLGSAVSIALTYRLHKIRSTNSYFVKNLNLVPASATLPPPVDQIEEGERLYAFWTVYVMDKSWAVALDCESTLVEDGSPATRIEAPWPLASQMFQTGSVPDDYRGSRTIQRFLNEPLAHSIPGVLSTAALRAQATALLDRAKWLSSTCTADPSLVVIHEGAFTRLDGLIEDFILSLPPLDMLRIHSPAQTRSLVTTHMVARLAIIQLHIGFSDSDVASAIKCLSASKAIIAAFKVLCPGQAEPPQNDFLYLEPFVQVLLTASAKIMLLEQEKFKQNRALWQSMAVSSSAVYMRSALYELLDQMRKVNPRSPFTSMQVAKLDHYRQSLGDIALFTTYSS
ncbi:hypothetical protein K474DRAFT_1667317 [Panus rudis PR-1116 ss-1]|nr:hypothetical protein K474DRAFT_1667317 [Panus rudis PR-1116 ss-1]